MTSSTAFHLGRAVLPERVQLAGRDIQLRLSPAARTQLARETTALEIELEVYFSCYLRKRVHFLRTPHRDVLERVALGDHVSLSVRMVMTQACAVAEAPAEPELEALPIVRHRPFIPRWVSIDYTGGAWSGEFGFQSAS